jgi:adenylate kinase
MNLVFLGPPGSGKGTQAKIICEKLGISHLSTGDLLREGVKNGTKLGMKAKKYMEAGDLVPDELIVALIEEKLTSGALNNGYILDGFPRTVPQAQSLKEMLAKNDSRIDKAVLIDVPDDEVIKRLSGRAKIEGRADDANKSIVKNRLEVYKNQTQPIIDFYQAESILDKVKGVGTIEEINDRLHKVIV